MEAIAGALVYAVVYLNQRLEDGDEMYVDQDIKALESIGGFLRHASWEEQDELAAAAERELAKELASPHPRADFIQDYSHWMEQMFPEGWVRNHRSPEGEG
jgi:hypothetical protein